VIERGFEDGGRLRSDSSYDERVIEIDGRVVESHCELRLGGRREVTYWIGVKTGVGQCTVPYRSSCSRGNPAASRLDAASDNAASISRVDERRFRDRGRGRGFGYGRDEEKDEVASDSMPTQLPAILPFLLPPLLSFCLRQCFLRDAPHIARWTLVVIGAET